MDEALERLQVWRRLADEAAAPLRREVLAADKIGPRDLERWRRRFGAELVAAAMDLKIARRKAKKKFPQQRNLYADPQGVEQATSELVATHKARRFADLKPPGVFDLCCGIGGDAMSLGRAAPLTAVDRDPLRTWMTEQNAGCATRCADVTELRLHSEVFHLDPARREESPGRRRRMHNLADYQPGPDFLADLLRRCPTGAVKLGPGVDFNALPEAEQSEVELISEFGTLVQAVLWTGELAQRPGQRTATSLPAGVSFTASPAAIDLTRPVGRYLYAADPALERGELLSAFAEQLGGDTAPLHEKLGLLTADQRLEHALMTGFELLGEMPYRQAKVKAALAQLGAGEVEVKTRGGAINPDEAQAALRGPGDRRLTVFVLRVGKQRRAYLCQRLRR